MRQRDVAAVILSVAAMYFALQQEGSFTFHPGWVHMSEAELGQVLDAEHLPPPVPADLNGDGKREVIVATSDTKLQVISPPTGHSRGGDFAPTEVLAEVSLLPARVRVSAGRRPVALSVGFLDPHKPPALRKQVVVVVTADWTVMCFDHNLRLMWEVNIQDDFPHHASIREVAIMATNHTVQKGDRGMVIVGGSIALGDLESEHDPLRQELLAEEREARHRRSAGDNERLEFADGVNDSVDKSRHFNYYAFEGASGKQRWKHESADFHRDASILADALTPQHHYKLDASSLTQRHFGEVECREYRKSVLSSMPHRWGRRQDTYFELRHFRKQRKKNDIKGAKNRLGNEKVSTVHSAVESFLDVALGSRAQGHGKRARTRQEGQHASKGEQPNVIVAHLQEGIEVVHLFTGRTLCKLLLPGPGLHADINGDGVLDHVQAHGWHPHNSDTGGERIPRCWATATSGVPVKEQLFNGSICRSAVTGLGSEHAQYSSRRNQDRDQETFSPLETALPALLPRHDSYLPHAGAAAGAHSDNSGTLHLRRGAAHDVVFLNSRGEVTAYGPEGGKRWQVQAHTSWQRGGYDGHQDVVPTLLVFSPRVGGRGEAVLAAGASLAHIISPGGKKMLKLELPDVPLAPLKVVDLNGDGLNDILVSVQGGVFAYLQQSRGGVVPFSTLLGVLIIAMLVVYFTQQVPTKNSKPVRSTD
eukprot:CAMPEP_0196591354 /NCGR_PEP_ID=MMETSP1081-20130531/69302_1 /TAXON_ID=36882 /ORGANISM="Pyramimonas amylifera, Strain CCMP720" /LENGTH=702 /DNA_ID=CAMNT_0041914685 /DNA_START=132 /DNA_END=2240 /DNA_ORIENTATION=+